MESLLKTHFWLVRLIGFSCGVAFLGSALVTYVGMNTLLSEEVLEKIPETILSTRHAEIERPGNLGSKKGTNNRTNKQAEVDTIVAGKPFCPTCIEPSENLDEDLPEAEVQPELISCTLPLMLLATMESKNASDSVAIIGHTENKSSSPYRVGDEILSNVTLESVERGRVILLNGKQRESLEVNRSQIPSPATPAKPANVDNPKPITNRHQIDGAEEAISCADEDSCTVDVAFRDKILNNPALLAKQARVVPAVRDGESRGFKFYGIRPGSLPKLLGLRNGDMITGINGNDLRSADQALALYTKLRRATHLSVVLERRGKTITKEVTFK